MQGVVRMYDPLSGEGLLLRESDRAELTFAPTALDGSLFQTLRQGQRINFELDGADRATTVRIGSEPDMGILDAQV